MTETLILDEINERISAEELQHFMSCSSEFKPSTIYLTPERYIKFIQEFTNRHPCFIPSNQMTWRNAEIKVIRSEW